GFSKRDANEEEPTIEKKYIAMILELEVENGNIIVNKQSVDKGLLFQQELEFVTLSVNEAKNSGYKVVFKTPIDYSIRKLNDGRYMARSDSPLLEITEDTTQEAKEIYLDALINWAIRIESSTNKEDRALFDQLIESIEVV